MNKECDVIVGLKNQIVQAATEGKVSHELAIQASQVSAEKVNAMLIWFDNMIVAKAFLGL